MNTKSCTRLILNTVFLFGIFQLIEVETNCVDSGKCHLESDYFVDLVKMDKSLEALQSLGRSFNYWKMWSEIYIRASFIPVKAQKLGILINQTWIHLKVKFALWICISYSYLSANVILDNSLQRQHFELPNPCVYSKEYSDIHTVASFIAINRLLVESKVITSINCC